MAKFERVETIEIPDEDLLDLNSMERLRQAGWSQVCRYCGGGQTSKSGDCWDCGEAF